ncbi:MAG TPA: sigma-54 dependent transcriptional regulator [Desulfosalsimonadaceae bacterium]|nr:sigma-54 dependent transcriptional regulator [Desulfosalsimonadaceae bacterium]
MSDKMRIMVVDDEMIVRESFYHWFTKYGHAVETAASGEEALEKLENRQFDLLFVDIKMPGMDGLELLDRVKTEYPETFVVIITAYGSIESAVKAMKSGASDYLLKPFKPDHINLVMEKINQQKVLTAEYDYLKQQLGEVTRFDDIIGQSPPMVEVFETIPEIADTDAYVLLTGETGTGKELVAKAIHAKSHRANFPFIAINCGAMAESLLESELFGHTKGAFTGAHKNRKGFLEVVSGGTLFLDEIGEISMKMQVDLLRVLEEKKIQRIGSHQPIDVDFRLICASSRNLDELIRAGTFREDFYYRINVIEIRIPTLRERKADIPLLIRHFLKKYSQETTKHVDHVDASAEQLLKSYDWPGNVRELENAIERAVVLSKSRTLSARDFSFLKPAQFSDAGGRTLLDVEKRHIKGVLDECGWNISQAARILDINRSTLHKKINKYELRQ